MLSVYFVCPRVKCYSAYLSVIRFIKLLSHSKTLRAIPSLTTSRQLCILHGFLLIITTFLIYLLPVELGVTVNGQHRSRRDNWSSTGGSKSGATSTDSTTKIKPKQPGLPMSRTIFTFHLWLIALLLFLGLG